MGDFVLLYAGGRAPESEEEQARVMKAWTDWFETIGAGLKDGGNPFGDAKTVSSDGSITDGHGAEHYTGYTIVTAASLDAATDIAKGAPVLGDGGAVTVYEVVPAM
ncbi:MAG TPA: YciI family protein [Actinomycetota bacterium]